MMGKKIPKYVVFLLEYNKLRSSTFRVYFLLLGNLQDICLQLPLKPVFSSARISGLPVLLQTAQGPYRWRNSRPGAGGVHRWGGSWSLW